MTTPRIGLDIAAFLDSSHVPRAPGLTPAVLRSALERILGACYDELGVAPHHLDGDTMASLLGEHLPRRFGRREPVLGHVVPLLRAFLDHLDEVEVVRHAYEIRRALDEHEPRFLAAVRSDEVPVVAGPGHTIRHRGTKVGRNDPCWCGSGTKFKKCHGRDI